MSEVLTRTTQPAWRSPWVMGWVAMVAIVLLANATMIYLAVATSPGLVVKDYYERGRHFERTVTDRQANDPGWLVQLDLPQQTIVDRPVTYRFVAMDKRGLPVRPDGVTLHAYRPSDAESDFTMAMEMEEPGRYRVRPTFPLKGIWDLIVSIQQGEEEYNLARRISVLGAQ
jgi:nitrogen fixation protein FixH